VDIAGISGSLDIVKIFARSLEADIKNYKLSDGLNPPSADQSDNKITPMVKKH
jgi:hypothetical protein